MEASKVIIDFEDLTQMYDILKREYKELLNEEEYRINFNDENCIDHVFYDHECRRYLYTLKDGQRYRLYESQDDMFEDYWWETLQQLKESVGRNIFVKDIVDKLVNSRCIDYDKLSYYAFANDYGQMIAPYDGLCIEILGWCEEENRNCIVGWLGRVE